MFVLIGKLPAVFKTPYYFKSNYVSTENVFKGWGADWPKITYKTSLRRNVYPTVATKILRVFIYICIHILYIVYNVYNNIYGPWVFSDTVAVFIVRREYSSREANWICHSSKRERNGIQYYGGGRLWKKKKHTHMRAHPVTAPTASIPTHYRAQQAHCRDIN